MHIYVLISTSTAPLSIAQTYKNKTRLKNWVRTQKIDNSLKVLLVIFDVKITSTNDKYIINRSFYQFVFRDKKGMTTFTIPWFSLETKTQNDVLTYQSF